jgi:hypothetical protein
LLLFENGLSALGTQRATISQFQKRLQSWMNDPNPDWTILCTDCSVDPIIIEYDFEASAGIWGIAANNPIYGTYVTGVGFRSVPASTDNNDQELRLTTSDLDVPDECIAIEIDIITPNVPNPTLYPITMGTPSVYAVYTFPNCSSNSSVYTLRVEFAVTELVGEWRWDLYLYQAGITNIATLKKMRFMRV